MAVTNGYLTSYDPGPFRHWAHPPFTPRPHSAIDGHDGKRVGAPSYSLL